MNRIISRAYNMSLSDFVYSVQKRFLASQLEARQGRTANKITSQLRNAFSVYKTPNLKNVSPEEFSGYIQSQIGVIDAKVEGYRETELDQQRDLSVKFHWGHNHDFGSFKMEGQMGDRHIHLLANFVSLFPITLEDFNDKSVLDIGCWTGGTTLLLAALGTEVFAIEEVKKYAEIVSYMIRSFGIDNRVTVHPMSVYDCNSDEFNDRFDIVYFPGVIYHLSDPVLALRILYNALKMDGTILIESAGINVSKPYCQFWGNRSIQKDGESGWAWFWPSPTALQRMMKEAGFDETKTLWYQGRVYGYAKKTRQVGICRAGLSDRNIG